MRMLRKLYVQARLDIDDDMMDAMIANEHIPTDHDDNGILRVDMDSCEHCECSAPPRQNGIHWKE